MIPPQLLVGKRRGVLLRVKCVLVLWAFAAGMLGCSRSAIPFDRSKWANPSHGSDRQRMLSAVTNLIHVNQTTKEDVLALLGTNAIPERSQNSREAKVFYFGFTNYYGAVYFIGEESVKGPAWETAWVYLCMRFDGHGVCTNLVINKPSF